MAGRTRKEKQSSQALIDADGAEASTGLLSARPKALVFISHDSRDGDLAEAFSNLLLDVSGGMLKSFRSSDNKGASGIEFGAEWYTTIISKLGYATDVVALLSQRSIDRPWILYEAGVAKGKLDTTVVGVALGVPLDNVVTGPFGQFQNCADDEDSQTKLVLQLLRRNPDADPREETVRSQVQIFREQIQKILKSRGSASTIPLSQHDDQSTAKLFEEVKAMVRELPDRLDERTRTGPGKTALRRQRRFHPSLLEDLVFDSGLRESEFGSTTAWLVIVSILKDDFPWLHEIGMDVYRALRSGSQREVERARRQFLEILRMTSRGPLSRGLLPHDDKETYFFLRHLDELLARIVVDSHRQKPDQKAGPSVAGSPSKDVGE